MIRNVFKKIKYLFFTSKIIWFVSIIFLIIDKLILLIAFNFLIMNGLYFIVKVLKSFKFYMLQWIIIWLIFKASL